MVVVWSMLWARHVITQTAIFADNQRRKIYGAVRATRTDLPAEDPCADGERRTLVEDASLVRLARAAVLPRPCSSPSGTGLELEMAF